MEKPNKLLYCYSQEQFDNLMKELCWSEPNEKSSTVSICSPWNEGYDHWFKPGTPNNMNIDCDDVVRPFWWKKDHYDEALKLYLDAEIEKSNEFFNYYEEDDKGRSINLRLLNYEQAFLLVSWINVQMLNGHDNFYVHCAAGLSRSQAVVRYIMDVYTGIHWKTRPTNPCTYYNNHMLLMLKRAARNLQII